MKSLVRPLTSVIACVLLVMFAVTLVGCAGDETTTDNAPAETTEQTAADQTGQTQEGEQLYTPSYKPNGNEIAVIKTPKGVIKMKFYPEKAPNHVAAFIELAQKGFYDGTTFHRVEPGFVVQGGDPYSKTGEGPVGTGGPGYNLKAEFSDEKHLEGTLAMARAQSPDSAGSQFYICLAAAPFLDGNYTVFGQVIEGMDVVKATAVGDVMESVTIENATK